MANEVQTYSIWWGIDQKVLYLSHSAGDKTPNEYIEYDQFPDITSIDYAPFYYESNNYDKIVILDQIAPFYLKGWFYFRRSLGYGTIEGLQKLILTQCYYMYRTFYYCDYVKLITRFAVQSKFTNGKTVIEESFWYCNQVDFTQFELVNCSTLYSFCYTVESVILYPRFFNIRGYDDIVNLTSCFVDVKEITGLLNIDIPSSRPRKFNFNSCFRAIGSLTQCTDISLLRLDWEVGAENIVKFTSCFSSFYGSTSPVTSIDFTRFRALGEVYFLDSFNYFTNLEHCYISASGNFHFGERCFINYTKMHNYNAGAIKDGSAYHIDFGFDPIGMLETIQEPGLIYYKEKYNAQSRGYDITLSGEEQVGLEWREFRQINDPSQPTQIPPCLQPVPGKTIASIATIGRELCPYTINGWLTEGLNKGSIPRMTRLYCMSLNYCWNFDEFFAADRFIENPNYIHQIGNIYIDKAPELDQIIIKNWFYKYGEGYWILFNIKINCEITFEDCFNQLTNLYITNWTDVAPVHFKDSFSNIHDHLSEFSNAKFYSFEFDNCFNDCYLSEEFSIGVIDDLKEQSKYIRCFNRCENMRTFDFINQFESNMTTIQGTCFTQCPNLNHVYTNFEPVTDSTILGSFSGSINMHNFDNARINELKYFTLDNGKNLGFFERNPVETSTFYWGISYSGYLYLSDVPFDLTSYDYYYSPIKECTKAVQISTEPEYRPPWEDYKTYLKFTSSAFQFAENPIVPIWMSYWFWNIGPECDWNSNVDTWNNFNLAPHINIDKVRKIDHLIGGDDLDKPLPVCSLNLSGWHFASLLDEPGNAEHMIENVFITAGFDYKARPFTDLSQDYRFNAGMELSLQDWVITGNLDLSYFFSNSHFNMCVHDRWYATTGATISIEMTDWKITNGKINLAYAFSDFVTGKKRTPQRPSDVIVKLPSFQNVSSLKGFASMTTELKFGTEGYVGEEYEEWDDLLEALSPIKFEATDNPPESTQITDIFKDNQRNFLMTRHTDMLTDREKACIQDGENNGLFLPLTGYIYWGYDETTKVLSLAHSQSDKTPTLYRQHPCWYYDSERLNYQLNAQYWPIYLSNTDDYITPPWSQLTINKVDFVNRVYPYFVYHWFNENYLGKSIHIDGKDLFLWNAGLVYAIAFKCPNLESVTMNYICFTDRASNELDHKIIIFGDSQEQVDEHTTVFGGIIDYCQKLKHVKLLGWKFYYNHIGLTSGLDVVNGMINGNPRTDELIKEAGNRFCPLTRSFNIEDIDLSGWTYYGPSCNHLILCGLGQNCEKLKSVKFTDLRPFSLVDCFTNTELKLKQIYVYDAQATRYLTIGKTMNMEEFAGEFPPSFYEQNATSVLQEETYFDRQNRTYYPNLPQWRDMYNRPSFNLDVTGLNEEEVYSNFQYYMSSIIGHVKNMIWSSINPETKEVYISSVPCLQAHDNYIYTEVDDNQYWHRLTMPADWYEGVVDPEYWKEGLTYINVTPDWAKPITPVTLTDWNNPKFIDYSKMDLTELRSFKSSNGGSAMTREDFQVPSVLTFTNMTEFDDPQVSKLDWKFLNIYNKNNEPIHVKLHNFTNCYDPINKILDLRHVGLYSDADLVYLDELKVDPETWIIILPDLSHIKAFNTELFTNLPNLEHVYVDGELFKGNICDTEQPKVFMGCPKMHNYAFPHIGVNKYYVFDDGTNEGFFEKWSIDTQGPGPGPVPPVPPVPATTNIYWGIHENMLYLNSEETDLSENLWIQDDDTLNEMPPWQGIDFYYVEIMREIRPFSTFEWFKSNKYIKTLDLTKINMSSVLKIDDMLSEMESLTSVNCDGWHFDSLTGTVTDVFYSLPNVTSISTKNWTFAKPVTLSYWYFNCPLLNKIEILDWEFKDAVELNMFISYCESLISVTLGQTFIDHVDELTQFCTDCVNLRYAFIPANFKQELLSVKNSFMNSYRMHNYKVKHIGIDQYYVIDNKVNDGFFNRIGDIIPTYYDMDLTHGYSDHLERVLPYKELEDLYEEIKK